MKKLLIMLLVGLIVIFVGVLAPFCLFEGEMSGYGTYLAGLAAILAVLRYSMPYILIFIYREGYSNELILKKLFSISIDPNVEGKVPQTGYLLGVIEFFKYVAGEDGYTDNDNWYKHLIEISEELKISLGNTSMHGDVVNQKFKNVKEKLGKVGGRLALYTSPAKPMLSKEEKVIVCEEFKSFVDEVKELESMIVEVPLPVKTIINANDFYKSFIKR